MDIHYDILNESEEVMPFGFGQHPAFNCPPGFKDTRIILDDKDELIVSEELFRQYPTYIYDPNPYRSAVLATNGHHLKLDFEGYDILAVWSPFAPFVCVEPWVTPDPDPTVSFEDREKYILLEPKEFWQIGYQITLVD